MNHLTQSLRRLVAAALVLLSLPVFSQLSGTYTIDPSGTGTTNYASFTAAVSALTTSGVSGPVTFNVTQGTYTEQVTINAITGTSTTNKVTFKSATANTLPVNVTFAGATAATNNWTLRLNGVNNLEFDGIKFSNTTPAVGTAIPFSCNVNLNGTTTNISYLNCSFTGSGTLGSANHAFFYETGSFQTGAWSFTNCQFVNTSRGINLNGSATNSLTSVTVTGCTFNTLDRGIFASNGFAVVAGSTATITNNTFAAPLGSNGYFSMSTAAIATVTSTGNTLNNYSGSSFTAATTVTATNNTVTGGNFAQGISVGGASTALVAATVSNNTLSPNSTIFVSNGSLAAINQNVCGSISVSSTNAGIAITNNNITTTGSGISISSLAGSSAINTGATAQGFTITNNRIVQPSGGFPTYGIYCSGFNIVTVPGLIANNTVSAQISATSSYYGIYPYQSKNVNIYHNTVTMTGGSATGGRALYVNNLSTGFPATGVNIQNNIFKNTGLGYVVEVATTSALGMVGSLSNNVYFGNTVNPFRLNSVNQTTLSGWQTASAKDAASVWGDVIFYGPSDLHVQNAVANDMGTAVASVTTDMDGQTRSATTPDAGADEYSPLSCISATVITVPTIGGNTATVSWTTANTPVSYKVRHRTNGTGAWTEGTQTATTKNLTGLQSYTAYEVQVKEFCSATDSSIWSPSTVFTTAIVPNWIENFQVAVPPLGWSRAAGRLLNPTVFSGTSTAWGQDDYGNQVPNGANGKSARVNIWSTNHFNWLMTPSIEIPNNVNSYQIEYDLALTTWNATTANTLGVDDTLALVVSLDNGLTWNKSNAVITYTAASTITPAGSHVIIPVPAAWKGNTIKLGWYSQSTVGNADNDVFVDNFEIKVSATCPITATPTVPAVTTCGPQAVTLSATWSNPAYQHIWLSPTGVIRGRGNSFTTPVLTASTTQDSRLIAADNSVSAVSGGPQITLTNPAGSGGNFTNGMWFTATQPFMLDSATVKAYATANGGTIKFLVRISEKAGSHAANTGAQLYLSDTITVTTTSTTGELKRIPINIPVLPGSYYVNLNFVAGTTGTLFRSTALPTGTTYPYALGGLGSLDSVQLGTTTSGNTRIYYLFNWKMSAACLGPIVTTNVTYASVPSVTLPHVSGFATGAPCNWVATAASGATWQGKTGYTGNGYTATTLNGTPFVMVDDDAAGSSASTPNSVLTTPLFPALGYDTLTMKFLSVFKGGSWGGKGYVEVWRPVNGVFGWQTIDSLSADEGIGAAATGWAAASKTYNVTAYQSNQFKARFRYDDKGLWAGWWAIDEFELNGALSPTGNVRVAVTTDIYGSEVSWKIVNTSNKLVYASGGPFPDVTPYVAATATHIDTVAIPLTGNFEFRLTDSYGDGLYDGTNTGTYIVEKLCAWGNSIIDTGSGANDNDPGGAVANVASYDSAVFNMSCIQYKNVTFNVDMNQVTQSFTTPEVNGLWNNWCGNCNPLTDANGDGIWTTTLPLPVGSTQEYKFSADAWTIQEQNNPAAPCTNGNATYTNRVIVIPATDTVLNVVCWSQCTACDVDVTLKVNMAWEVANNAISANGVHVAGDFQGWSPSTTPMTDANNDGIYEVTVTVPANSSIQYKFINGNAWGADESVPAACVVPTTMNRGATFAYGDSTLSPVCFGKCTDCAAGLGESLQNVSLFPNPTRGQFNLARMDAATEVEVSVLDLQGKVLTVAKWNEGVDALSIDLSSFANGVYMVRMTSEEGSRTMRVSVQK